MPCDGGGWSGNQEAEYWEERLRHDSPTAEAFCELCQVLEESGIALTPSAARWWKKHKDRDRKRVEKEVAAQKERKKIKDALEKLTPYERKLLGVK